MGSAPKRWLYYYSGLPAARVAVLAIAIVGLFILSATPGAADARLSGGGTLSGVTSQGMPGNIRVSGTGRIINEASISVVVRCSFGPMILPQKLRLVPIKPGGRFKESLEGSDIDDEGMSVRLYETFSGTFNRDRTSVMAKSRIYLTFHNPDGSVEKCDSGLVRLRAHS